jgi:hypothetical protein
VQPRRVGRAHVDPGAKHAGEIAHRERRLIGIGQPAGEGQAFGVLEAIGEHARDEMLFGLRGMARHLERQRLVHAAVDIRQLDSEIVDRCAKRQGNLRR